MADNLTISIGADSSKLRADLAVAQAEVKEFGAQLRAAAKESLTTGDTSAVSALAGQYDAAVARANALKGAIKGVGDEHAALRSPLAAAAAAFSGVRAAASEFGAAVSNVANSVFPHFKEVLALSLAGAAAEFVHLAESSADSIRETQNFAQTVGLTTEQVEALHKVAANAGVPWEQFERAILRSSRNMGTFTEEAIKASGQVPNGINVMRGPIKGLADDAMVARGGVNKLADALTGTVLRGGNALKNADFKTVFAPLANLNDPIKQLQAVSDILDKIPNQQLKNSLAAQQFGPRTLGAIAPALKDLTANYNKALADIQKSGLALSEEEKAQAKEFTASIENMKFYAERFKAIIGGSFGQLLIPIFDEITRVLKENSGAIRAWASETGELLKNVARDFIDMFRDTQGAANEYGQGAFRTDFARNFVSAKDQIVGALTAIKEAFFAVLAGADLVAAGINRIFGTNFTGEALLATAAVLKLSGVLPLVALGIRGVTAALAFFLANPVGLALTGLALIALEIYQNWETIGPMVQALWDKYQAFGAWVRAGLADAFTSAWNAIVAAGQAVLNFLDNLWQKAKAAASAIASVVGGGSGASTDNFQGPFASGGYVSGPGTATSDSIPARLSNGEYVVSAPAVSRIGVGALDRINSLKGFALGGRVGRFDTGISLPRFAGGGPVGGGGTPINLHIGNRSYRTSADGSVAGALVREARLRQLSSTGNKPSWAGA
jgi:hypothetical protein